MRRIFRRLRLILQLVLNYKQIVKQNSYYPEEKRKSSLRVAFEYLMFIIRYGEMPRFYFVYGLDRVSSQSNEYMAYSEFMSLRQKKNTVHVGSQTSYSYACLLRDKQLFEWISEKYEIPTPRVIGMLLGGVICDENRKELDFINYCQSLHASMSLFLKEQAGNKGSGAYSLDKVDGKYFLNDKLIALEQLKNEFPSDCTFIVQKRLKQHPVLSNLYPNALNTLRVVSVIYQGQVVIIGTLLRLGANGSVVDNWAHGGVAIGVKEDGKLNEWALFKPGYGTKTDRHPNSGVVFKDYQLPYWNEVIDLVKTAHWKLKEIGTIGWDIAITEDGPVVIEGNDDYDGALLQACTGGKKKEFLKYYS